MNAIHQRVVLLVCAMLCIDGAALAQAPTSATTDAERAAWTVPDDNRIHAVLAERMQFDGVGVVVGVLDPNGRRIVVNGRSGTKRALDGDTIFQIGSVTKTFTGLLLADMAIRGEVAIDDPAAKYLPPGVTMPLRGRPITLMDLATHQSGLPSMPTNFFLGGMPNPYQAYTPVDLHSFLSSYALTREPGAQEEYSNLGVALLGRLLSQRAGTDYEKLLQDRVLRPLGMSSTAVTLNAEQLSRLAPGHDRYLELVAPWNLDTLPGSGGLRSSANDLLNYLEAFLGYRETALKSAMEYGLSTRQPPGSTNAVTWGVSRSGTREVFGHDGGKEGYRAAIVFNPRTRTGIVVLANSRTDDRPMALAWHLLYGRPLPRTTRAPTKPTVPAPATESLDLLAGRYELAPGKILIVARRDKHLLVDTTGAGVESFYYAGTDEFASNENDARLLFTRAEAGRGSEVMLVQGGQKSGAKRVQ